MRALSFTGSASVTIICFLHAFLFIPSDAWAFRSSDVHKRGSRSHLNMVHRADEFATGESERIGKVGIASDSFLKEYFQSEIDDVNLPPSMSIIRRSIGQLASGSDIRGQYVPNPSTGRLATLARAIGQTNLPALTPFAAHCLGFAFATMVKRQHDVDVTICIGKDPREHGIVLADSFARGAGGVKGVKVVFTGIATTPALFEFCRSSLCHGGVMVTASHLPSDRNGMKFFDALNGGFQKHHIQEMIEIAQDHAHLWFDIGILPPSSIGNVYCDEYVNWMNHYKEQLKQALITQVANREDSLVVNQRHPLRGLNIVLNSGNGSGGFFRTVLEDLGANIEGSINIEPDSLFPNGIPNPEKDSMVEDTIRACEATHADLGILLDTDADRCGMVAPRTYTETSNGVFEPSNYEAINKNRLIALMGVIYSRQFPGCTIVTDSVTSNGLSKFLQEDLNLEHIRYLRGYANVIKKAKSVNEELSGNAEVAIETSGHCAVRENGFLDDGTFTAIKVLGLLAQENTGAHIQDSESPKKETLLGLLSNLEELDEVIEFRLPGKDGTLESVIRVFDLVALDIETECENKSEWSVDRENLEGIRVLIESDGGYFLLRKSLHDPVMCLQVEATSKEAAQKLIIAPLLALFHSEPMIAQTIDLSALKEY